MKGILLSIWTSLPIPQVTLPWQSILSKICKLTFIRHPDILKRIEISQYG